jgi:hypothetical protein
MDIAEAIRFVLTNLPAFLFVTAFLAAPRVQERDLLWAAWRERKNQA